ncbi:MAG: WecB/TagA/CpsF family glycosyltransferase [Proteobacteria bacterium]|nr:WecB/TagA/CpsF family glycosyltransferase [Pseudomonadota bacterium]
MPGQRSEFLGIEFDLIPAEAVPGVVLGLARTEHFSLVVTPNVDHVVRLHQAAPSAARDALWAAYRSARLCLCDSRILARLARLGGVRLPVVTGSDLTAALLASPLEGIRSIALIGGTQRQCEWLAERHPQITWLHHVPPMGLRTNAAAQQEVADFVVTGGADIVLLAIGSPQSEIVAGLVSARKEARGVALCIGASVEFVTGEKRRAPPILGRLGLEWAFRLASEPGRLWRRYLVDGPRIFPIWLAWYRARPRRNA